MKKTTVKLMFTHVWETPRKNYLPSPFAVAAQLLQWTPIPPSWQALVPPGIKTTSLPLVLMQPPQYNQSNSAQQQQKCTRTGYTTSFYFQPCFLPTAVLTWLKDNTFHMVNKKEISLKFRRCRGNELTEFNSSGDFHSYFLLCSFPPLHKLPALEGH